MKLHYHIVREPHSEGEGSAENVYLRILLELGGRTGEGGLATEQPEHLSAVLEKKRPWIEKFALTEPQRYIHYLEHLLPEHPGLVSALAEATRALWSRLRPGIDPKSGNTGLTAEN